VRIFSKADNLEQIRVRIDDKLSRIMRGNGLIQEDTVFDLMGYLVLLRVAQRQEREIDLKEKHETKHTQEENGKDTTAEKPVLSLTEADLTVPKFPHDKTLEKWFRTLFYFEHPDGRVVLNYMSGLTYTTKEKVLKLPFPFENGYFKNAGFQAATHITAIRLYREFLFLQENEKRLSKTPEPAVTYVGKSSRDRILEAQEQKRKQELETEAKKPVISKEDIQAKYAKMLDVEDPEEWKYRPMLNTNTRPNLDEEKVEGDLT
jgi:cell division protein ZapA (FtsZ GTPase activity inhibitor)